MKHHAPISERCRCGRVRRTFMARGPPRGTARAVMISTGARPARAARGPGRPPSAHTWVSGFASGLVTVSVPSVSVAGALPRERGGCGCVFAGSSGVGGPSATGNLSTLSVLEGARDRGAKAVADVGAHQVGRGGTVAVDDELQDPVVLVQVDDAWFGPCGKFEAQSSVPVGLVPQVVQESDHHLVV